MDADGRNKQQPCSAKTPEATFSVTRHTAFQLQWESKPGYPVPNDFSEEKGTPEKSSPPISLSPAAVWASGSLKHFTSLPGPESSEDLLEVRQLVSGSLEPRTPVSHP